MNEFNIFIRKIYQDMYDNGGNTVIHCSAGVGRTGVVYVVLQLLSKGYRFRQASDIKVIKTMIDNIINIERQNRNHLFVQTADQYNFIYRYFTGLDMRNYSIEYNTLNQIQCIKPKNSSIMIGKNRWSDIIPCESKRVKLDNEKYINASNMSSFLINGKEIKIIAAQCPIPATIEDFYEMLRTYNIKRIIMVTGLVENGRLKCEDYFGSTSTSKEYINIEGVSVKVTLDHKQENDPIEIRTLTLKLDVPSRPRQPMPNSNPFLTNYEVKVRELDKLNLALNALQPFPQNLSGKNKSGRKTTQDWFERPILDIIYSKIDSYVKDEKNLGDIFKIAIEDNKNNTLDDFKPLYPEYFNKFAKPKIVEYSAMEKKTDFLKTNKTKTSKKYLLEEIMTYGFGKEDIKNFIRLQYNMPIILEKLTKGKKTKDMFRLSDNLVIKTSFYTNPNFELTSEVLEDTDTLCSLVKEYIGLLSKIKGSYFEEKIKTKKDLAKPEDTMLDDYLLFYPKEDQELLYKIFKLFSLIMKNPETEMRPEHIGDIFMLNVEPQNPATKDRIDMYIRFFEYIRDYITIHTISTNA